MAYIGAGITRFNTADELTVTGDAQIDGTTLVVDSTNNRVGIGTSSPASLMHLESDTPVITLRDTSAYSAGTGPYIQFQGLDSGSTNRVFGQIYGLSNGSNSGELAFHTRNSGNTAERMRIDSSGNLLVGTTSTTGFQTSSSATGTIAYIGGTIATNVSGDGALYLNRLTSDGNIALFRKDGTTVGSIGVASTDHFYFAAADGAGLKVDSDQSSGVTPCNASGADLDNSINLGHASARWNNLYLSGGAYLGGTGSANYLDDYEEGTWTPVAAGGGSNPTNLSHSIQSGNYVKIGGMVYVSFRCRFSFDSGTGSGTFNINGLPFTAANHTQPKSAPQHDNISFSGFEYLEMSAGANSTSVVFAKNRSAAGANSLLLSDCNASSTDVNGGFMYFV